MNKVVAIIPWGDVIEDFLDPIGLTVHQLAQDMSGGWLFGYVEALQQAGWSPLVLAPSSTVRQVERLTHAATGAPIWLVPGYSSQGTASPSRQAIRQWRATPLRAFRQVLRQERCHALLVQDYERPQFDALVALGRSLRVPVFATFQGGDRTLSRVERLIRARSIAEAAGLIIAASAERERVAAAYRRARVANIPNPIDVQEWRPFPPAEARAALGLANDTFVAVTHGRIDIHRKGLDLLLAAWTGPGELVLIGSGQDREQLATMVEGRTGVRWIDTYTNDREFIRRWLSASDVYVSASRIEGMPVAPLEAMACGLPVIGSTAQGLADMLASEGPAVGLLFPSENVAMLAAAIGRLRDDPALRRTLGHHGRELVEQRFSIESVANALDALLHAALDRRLAS
ncbi:glycosyltransferase family 4 protein [Sphingomonas sp. BN140010]|uniref:Glycosyltransferase family 4 protein n=1 Tax=Sphingomonas arvum TaxID=2992113 RepID=A0ABT3JE59_9SPHN|nr:glycosyltransferase family 4 protein [Sphingomonas sp. BN140010]MCW3797362.1 glycosyltransferase family 4 protein [Sphingomonas sp. BN140010]